LSIGVPMSYYRRIEEDEWLRQQRRNQHNSPSIEPQSNRNMLTAFKSMTRVELEWIAAWYQQFMQHQQLHLWKRFEALSIGQKRALLLDIAQTNHKPINKNSQPDWKEWSERLSMMAEVPLQEEEAFQEKRRDDVPSLTSFYMMKQSELLSPYREILWWLCYKGNHQGQQDLLQTIDQLGLDAKKLLILRLNGKQKCSSLHFSQQLTMIQHEQTVVDWDRIKDQLHSLQQLAADEIHAELLQLEPDSQSQMAPPNALLHTTIDEDEQDELEERSYLNEESAYSVQDVQTSTDTSHMQHQHGQRTDNEFEQLLPLRSVGDRRNSLLKSLVSEHELATLLANLSHAKHPKPMKRIDFVDLCLKIPRHWSSTKRDKARTKKFQSLNFSSLQQFFEFIILFIVTKLYQDGVLKRKPKDIEHLRALSLMKGGAIPSQEAISKQLLARFEQ